MSESLRIVVAGGGTGGHVYPGIAVVERLRERMATEALFVGARGGVEAGILERAGLTHELLPGYGLRRASVPRRIGFPFVLGAGVLRAAAILRGFSPDVVLGTGGYASAAVVIAAILLGRRRVLQEQNSVPGLVNRRLARFADLTLLAYGESASHLPHGARTRVVGNPLRRLPAATREAAAGYFKLDASRPTVLVVGGSRGAHSLNVAGAVAATTLAAKGIQCVILAGRGDAAEVRSRTTAAADTTRVLEYLDEMQYAYAIADVAVARAGASSVFELAAFGVPAIFVPYPYAADDHQESNAQPLARTGAARLLRDADLDGERLAREIEVLLSERDTLAAMARAMRAWATPDAAERAADAIIELSKKKEPVRRAA